MTTQPLQLLIAGSGPLLINVPHAGTHVPDEIRAGMTAEGEALPDTDWHVPFLYQHAVPAGATLLAATHSRYVIDLNRDPDGVPLYPDADNTELCPTLTFDNAPIYQPGRAPDAAAVASRMETCWAPYHALLRQQIDEIRERNGHVVLLDAHSIRSHVPRFFDGELPDLNLGTADGRSCSPALEARALEVLEQEADFTRVLNGRFKGGYITRHYGRPEQSVHALQLEIAQSAYMSEAAPYPWDADRALPLITVLRKLVDALISWRARR